MDCSRVSVIKGNQCAFKGTREDLNSISELSKNDKPLTANKKRNILAALNNVAKSPSDKDLAFLLSTADRLKYGVKRNSEFAEIIDPSASSTKENTAWDEILDNTIKNAIESSDSTKKDEFLTEYNRVFKVERPLTKGETELLELRSQVLNSSEMKNVIDDSEKIINSAKITENLDYFLSSSEISMHEKKQCLKKMNHFLSDDYKINEQLKDKKLQALSEMINDMLVKTPASPILKIKEVNQRQTGMCAAISICRKAIAYEDKANYMDIVMAELNDSPTMPVFDITKLEDQKKVQAKKTSIDFNDALRKGYRIIDASAHQWMHLAGTVGDGGIAIQSYTAFDNKNHEIFKDSIWYDDLPLQYKPYQDLLRLTIKEKSVIDEISKTKEGLKRIQIKIGDYKNEHLDIVSKSNEAIFNSIKSISPEITIQQARTVTNGVLHLEKTKNADVKINPSESDGFKKAKITKYIKSEIPSVSDEQISKKIDAIYGMYTQSNASSESLAKLNKHEKLKSKYSYYNKLFNLAAVHRKSVESVLDISNNVAVYEKSLGIVPREQQIEQRIDKLKNSLNSQAVVDNLAKELNVAPNKKDVEEALNKELTTLQVEFPTKIDSLLAKMSMGSRTKILQSFLTGLKNNILQGDVEAMDQFAQNLQVKNEKLVVLKKIDSYISDLDSNPSNKKISEITRTLGYDDQLEMLTAMYDTYVNMLNSGVDENTMRTLSQNLGKPLSMKKAVNRLANEINAMVDRYDGMQEHLAVPSRKDIVLKKLEENKEILPKSTINQLQNRFDGIFDERVKREKLKAQGTEIKDDSIYKFTKDEVNVFDGIDAEFPKMRKFANSQYKTMNAYLEPQLSKLYGDTGKLSGSFWIQEEGHSGLPAHQSVRIFEQMTGQPYYIEKDILKATEQIKQGNGSGTICTSVLDSEYALHAQYVPEISSVEMLDPKTKQKVIKDVLWHDNSWGKIENEGKWLGEDGLYHTDYEGGYGGETGYIFGEDFKTGTLVSDMNSKFGVLKDEDEKFPLFFNMVMPGVSPVAYQKLHETFSYIFDIKNPKKQLDKFEAKIKAGERVNIKELEGIDDLIGDASEKYFKRVQEELTTQEKYDNLQENDLLKFFLEKLSIYKSTTNPQIKNMVLEVTSREEMDELKAGIKETQKGYFEDIFNKSPETLKYVMTYAEPSINEALFAFDSQYKIDLGDKKAFIKELFDVPKANLDGSFNQLKSELTSNITKVVASKVQDEAAAKELTECLNLVAKETLDTDIAINSLDDLYEGNETIAEPIIKWIDKTFETRTDADLLKAIKKLQHMNKSEFDALTKDMSDEDLGIKYENPYNYVVKMHAQNEETEKAFNDIVGTYVVVKALPEDKEDVALVDKMDSDKEEDDSIEELYRGMYINFSNIDVDKYIKKYKAQVFDKYQVRPAFPQISIVAEKDLSDCIETNLKMMIESISSITNQHYVITVLEMADKAKAAFDINPELNTVESYDNFNSKVKELYALTKKDTSLQDVNKTLEALTKTLDAGYGNFDVKRVNKSLQSVTACFDGLKSNNLDVVTLKDSNKELGKEINNHIDLFVKSNILPRYQDDIRSLIKSWIREYDAKPDSQREIAAYNDVLGTALKRHITKEPNELLHSYVDQLQSKTKNKEISSVLRHYMELSVQTAQLAKVEYKLVKNENQGIAAKTGDLMDMFHVTLDGKSYALDTDEGIAYLLEQLSSENDNNSALRLFFTQTGLSEKAVGVIIKNFKLPAVNDYIVDSEKGIAAILENSLSLQDSYKEFSANNNIQYSSFSDASKHLLTVLEKSYETKSPKDKNVYKIYKAYIDQATKTDFCKKLDPSLIVPTLNQVHIDAMLYLNKQCNSAIEQLHETGSVLQERANVVMAMEIADTSSASKDRQVFISKIIELNQQLQESLVRVNETVAKFNSDYAQNAKESEDIEKSE